MTALEGHYNGSYIEIDEKVVLHKGQRVIITILDPAANREKRPNIDLRKYMGRGEKLLHGDANDYVKELRSGDRL